MSVKRRDFLTGAGGLITASTALAIETRSSSERHTQVPPNDPQASPADGACIANHAFNGSYEGAHLEHIAFPLGGFGAGMVCLEGAGALSHVSVQHRPDLRREPDMYAAISVQAPVPVARVLEGPVPSRKLGRNFSIHSFSDVSARWGLPRFQRASFKARFPFAEIALSDPAVPLQVKLTGWSPFEPGDADNSSLPVAGLEYKFTNTTAAPVDAVFSFNALNFMAEPDWVGDLKETGDAIKQMPGGFTLYGAGAANKPWDAGAFAIWVDDPAVKINAAWPRGAVLDVATLAWRDVEKGACYERAALAAGPPAPGASLFVPIRLTPGDSKTIAVRLAWFVQRSNLNRPGGGKVFGSLKALADPTRYAEDNAYKPWYAGRFADIDAVAVYWRENYDRLKHNAARFTQSFYDSTLPPEVLEAVAANLSILKSTTVLRQADGRLWAWEGSWDEIGSSEGSCTHVWNYAQALAHLFPALERTLRETELRVNQREDGHQDFRTALPIRPTPHTFQAAADGQLGGIIKMYRDWRISGDTSWMRGLWPWIRSSLDNCIRTWDPQHEGWLKEPQHNTYDIEFWGPNGMCTSTYLAALRAAVLMGQAADDDVTLYARLLKKGIRLTETKLFNGEYFLQIVQWRNLQAHFPEDAHGYMATRSPDMLALAQSEGPPYQYGSGCLSDGVVGAWLALVCGVGQVLSAPKVRSHLRAVHSNNFRQDLSTHVNPQRSAFALGREGGLLLCSWPRGRELSLPFMYSDEVWTGTEYQVASHLMLMGIPEEALEIVRTCRRRYDGRSRNPFGELEAGKWYGRALSSYALLQGLSGARYDAVDRVLYLKPAIKGDFRSFLSTATGYGTVGVRAGAPFIEVASGEIPCVRVEYIACA
jgi:uncharacterized protein (DUF608 family)